MGCDIDGKCHYGHKAPRAMRIGLLMALPDNKEATEVLSAPSSRSSLHLDTLQLQTSSQPPNCVH